MAKLSASKSKLVVFDLDYTLWPYFIECIGTPPFRKTALGTIQDSRGSTMKHYPEASIVLERLHKAGFILGIASRSSAKQEAEHLIEAFNWKRYFTYVQIFPGCKVTHFQNIHKQSGIPFDQMVFFDDESRNIHDVSKLGVYAVLVENGVNCAIVQKAVDKFPA